MEASEFTRNIQTFGVARTLGDLTLRGVNRAAFLKIMDYTGISNIVAARMFGRFVVRADEGCRAYGFRLEWMKRRPSDNDTARSGARTSSAC